MIIPTRRHRARLSVFLVLPLSLMSLFYIQLNRQFQHVSLLRDLGLSEAFGGTIGSVSSYANLLINNDDGNDGSLSQTVFPAVVDGGMPPSPIILAYWRELLDAMEKARPDTDKTVIITDSVTEYDVQPDPAIDAARERIDKIHLADEERDALRHAHARFVGVAHEMGQRLPYDGKDDGPNDDTLGTMMRSEMESVGKMARRTARRNSEYAADGRPEDKKETSESQDTSKVAKTPSRGIVMTAGGAYTGVAVTSLLMLRRSGSQLPVQIFLDSDEDYDSVLCGDVLPRLGATCHVMQRYWEATPQMKPLSKYQFKVFSLLLSSFQQVLFLDADCWPVRSPDFVFDSEPFTSRGLVTWPDFWLSTAAPVLYGDGKDGNDAGILGIPAPSLTERRSSESGIILYDKARQGASLLLAAYYNFYGPDYYYPLFSQGAVGQGDKETFLHGALVAGSPFYDVRSPIGILGRWQNGSFVGAAMRQADPAEDFALFGTSTHPSRSSRPPKQTSSELRARPLFVHHNLVKIDIRRLGASMQRVYAPDADTGKSRLWHVDADFLDGAGYDVELALWREVLRARCGRDEKPSLVRECSDMRRYVRQVFGSS